MWFNAKVCDHPLSLRQISSSSFFLAPLPSDLSVMDMIEKVIFQSQQWLALLPASMREVLMTCHSLDYSLAPDAAEQSILQHIFQALCFVDKSPPLTHCCLIQSHFGSLQSFLAHIYNVLFVLKPTKTQLESYSVCMGM